MGKKLCKFSSDLQKKYARKKKTTGIFRKNVGTKSPLLEIAHGPE